MQDRAAARSPRVSDSDYPPRLKDLARPPDPVHLLGPWNHPGPLVAIVGSRNATDDGLDVARDLARTLAERGAAVVSGLARGIDAAAHEGALDAGGLSGAVLGTPLDVVHPRQHRALQERLARSLGLMSELPGGSPVTQGTFASRNRILAAISHAVIVVQGRAQSGALITAEAARRLERPVGAIPWDSRDPMGEAPHGLIRAGKATLVRHADDVMDLVRLAGQKAALETQEIPFVGGDARYAPNLESLGRAERALFAALRDRPRPIDDLARIASLSAAEVSVALLALELIGLAERAPGGLARRARGGH